MPHRIYTLAASFGATTDNKANVEIAAAGKIKAIKWAVAGDLDADGEFFEIEIAKVPYMSSNVHDGLGGLSQVKAQASGTPAAVVAINQQDLMNVPVVPGERLYLNGVLTTTTDVKVVCIVHVE